MTSFSSSGRPARPTPSSERISRKRSLYGRRMTLAIRSGGIVELVRSTGTRAAVGDLLVRLADLAVDEVLADQRLVADAALASRCAARRSPARCTSTSTSDLVRLRVGQLELVDRAGADAADLQVAALDEAERVVELDPVASCPRAVARGAGEHDRGERGAEHDEDREPRASFGRPRRAVGLEAVELSLLLVGPDVRAVRRGRLGRARAALVLVDVGELLEDVAAARSSGDRRRRC